mgnify:CR=1 FL=1
MRNYKEVEAEGEIEIIKTEKFLGAVKELSDYIIALPLSNKENDRLVELILKQTSIAQKDAFLQGADLTAKAIKALEGKPKERVVIYGKL